MGMSERPFEFSLLRLDPSFFSSFLEGIFPSHRLNSILSNLTDKACTEVDYFPVPSSYPPSEGADS
jgi:hypothetical protein